jgi:3-oxoacyl-[acyl-carrier-protein] synthase III
VRLSSVVSLTPPYTYTNDEIAAALDLPALPKICRRIGIRSRRTFIPLDLSAGRIIGDASDRELEVAEQIASNAISEAGISPKDIAAICFISCTAQHGKRLHFELSSHNLVRRLGLNTAVHRFEIDAGCDGFVHILHVVRKLFRLTKERHVLVVTTSIPSLYFSRERSKLLPHEGQFSNYVFGDGAAAAVLSSAELEDSGVVKATWTDCEPTIEIAWTSLSTEGSPEVSYNIDFSAVDKSYVTFITRATRALLAQQPLLDLHQIDRFYFHQANGVLPHRAAQELGICPEKLATNARDSANTGAASIPIMLAEDYRSGVVRKGSRVLLASVGAGLDYSSALIEY